MNMWLVESRRHVVALSWIAVKVGLYHVAIATHLFDGMLKLPFVARQTAIESGEQLPHGLLTKAGSCHEKEGTLSWTDRGTVDGGGPVPSTASRLPRRPGGQNGRS